MLMEANDSESDVDIDHILGISKVTKNWRPTGEEMANFLGITVGIAVVYFVLITVIGGLVPFLLTSF